MRPATTLPAVPAPLHPLAVAPTSRRARRATRPRRLAAALLLPGLLALTGCGDAGGAENADGASGTAGDATAAEPPGAVDDVSPAASDGLVDVVRTTFHPTTYFAERIAGDLVAVDNLVPASADPIFWTPTRDAIAAYQRSRLIVVNGADYERWVSMAALPESRTVVTTRDFEEPFIIIEGITHSHGPAGEHSHDGIDGHTWVDPVNAIRQARTLAEAMQATWPEHAEAFAANLEGLVADLEEVDASLRALTPRLEGVTLIANHPAYNYLARRYGWTITNVDMDPEALPGGAALADVRDALPASDEGQVIMLWEAEPLDEIRQLLFVDMGVESVVFDPGESVSAADRAEGIDLLHLMRRNVEQLGGLLPPT